jgi:leucyl-tRNA synthetase
LPPGDPLSKLAHRTISEVSSNFDELRFNVAIARMTELSTTLAQFVHREGTVPRQLAETLVLLTFPLAPHVAAELWEKLGHPERIDDVAFPAADPDALKEVSVTLPVTMDGRPRGTITIDPTAPEGEALASGLRLAAVARLMEGRQVVRVVYVPGTILNLVTRASG